MLAARARVPFACMIWQVVPSTSTRKSINLDLARAARYRYFTKNRPAHADQNSDQSTLFLAVNLPAVRVGHGVGPGWERSRRRSCSAEELQKDTLLDSPMSPMEHRRTSGVTTNDYISDT